MVLEAELRKICPTCGRRYGDEFRACPEDGTLLIESGAEGHDDNLVGQVIKDTYVFAKILGEGAMARVYEASHTRLRGKRFAIKVLHPEFCVYKEILQRFRREAEAASSIDSRHIIEVYDVDDTPDGRPFMITELLRGNELGDLIHERGPLPPRMAVAITRQICEALTAAHKAGIIHRDLKPENIFLVGDPERPFVKVIDFGISKDSRPGTQLTQMGSVIGTPSFMAPEQAKGQPVTPAADVYAVGSILYTMLTGQRPFDGDEPTQILQALLTREPPPLRSLNPQVPTDLEAVVSRAMAKNPVARTPSAQILDEGLELIELGLLEQERALRPSITLSELQRLGASPTLPEPEVPVALGTARFGAWIWLLLCAIGIVLLGLTLVAAAVRLYGERGLGGLGAVLTVLALFLVLSTPLILVVRYAIRRHGDAATMGRLGRAARTTLLAAGGAYALVWWGGRAAAAVAAPRSDVVDPLWELSASFGGAVVALVVGLSLARTMPPASPPSER